jgi:hypothetical protein
MRIDTLRLSAPVEAPRVTGVHRRHTLVHSVLPATGMPPAMPMPVIVAQTARSVVQPVAQPTHVLEPAIPSAAKLRTQKAVVGVYRFAGLSILTIIVSLLLTFIISQIFYLFSTSWVSPNTIAVGDIKVVAMQTELSARQNQRDALAAQLAQAEATVAMNERFQAAFVTSVRRDLGRRKTELAKLSALQTRARGTTGQVRAAISGYAQANRKYLADQLDAGLVKGDQILAGNFESAQVQAQSIGMAEQQASIELAAADMAHETESLDAILDESKQDDGLAYDVLKIQQEYMQSKTVLSGAIATRDQLKAAVAREDALIQLLKSSVYVRAITDKAMIAYVPYDNLGNAKPGAPLYACKLGFVVCHRVGTVQDTLAGEIQFTHPKRDKQVRGQAVELDLLPGEMDAVQNDVLFVGAKPFLF